MQHIGVARTFRIEHDARMWVLTTYGFFSAVSARQGDGEHGRPVDPARIMVRVRRREHLERLIERFPDELGAASILETGKDYRFRIIIGKVAWSEVLRQLALATDYDNFKSTVEARLAGEADAEIYEDALHEVWGVMYGIQSQD